MTASAGDDTAGAPSPEGLENTLAEVVNRLQDGLFVLDRAWRFAYLNEKALAYVGMTDPSEIVGRCLWEEFPAARGSAYELTFRRVMERRESTILEVKGTIFDRWFRLSVSPVHVGISVVWTDITDRIEAEEALRESERRTAAHASELQTVLATVPAAVWIARDPLCLRIDSNRRGHEVLRRPEGSNLSVTAPSEERPTGFHALQDGQEVRNEDFAMQVAARTGNEVNNVEQAIVFDDGHVVHLLGNAAPLLDESGQPCGAVGAFIDITQRKRTEEELRDREERLRAVLENMSDGLVMFDTNGKITYQNPSSVRIHQHKPSGNDSTFDQLVLNWTVRKYPDGSPVPSENWAIPRVLRGERVQNESFFVDCAEQPTRSFVGIYNGSPVYDATGKIAYGFLTIKDIREQASTEAALRVSNERLLEANRRKDEFIALLGHELRNPLAPIRNASHLLDRVDAGSEQATRARAVLRRQSEHLTRLVDDLLDVARISHGKISLERSQFDLRDAVVRAAEDFRVAIADGGIAFRMELPDAAIWVDADATRVNQVVTNLIHNAAKFTPRGGEVVVSLRTNNGAAELRVLDTGSGIDPAVLPTLFQPFMQGERTIARSQGGLGLGLALVKGLVELQGGEVHAESAGAGKGASFTVRLPVRVAPAASGDAGTRGSDAGSGRRILVIDDNRDSAESLADLLRFEGHLVEVAFDGASALTKLEANSPDAVLCDIGLPGMSGYEIARAIRARGHAGLQLIALSGYAQGEDVRQAIEAGFDAHLAKPPDPEEIGRLLAPEQ